MVNFTRPTEKKKTILRREEGWATRDDVATMCQRPNERDRPLGVVCIHSGASSGRVLLGTCQQDDPSKKLKKGQELPSHIKGRAIIAKTMTTTPTLLLRFVALIPPVLSSLASLWRQCKTLFVVTDAEDDALTFFVPL